MPGLLPITPRDIEQLPLCRKTIDRAKKRTTPYLKYPEYLALARQCYLAHWPTNVERLGWMSKLGLANAIRGTVDRALRDYLAKQKILVLPDATKLTRHTSTTCNLRGFKRLVVMERKLKLKRLLGDLQLRKSVTDQSPMP